MGKNGIANKAVAYSFTIGVVIALVLGLISNLLPPSAVPWLWSLLIVAGILVGFGNITPTETKDYVLYVTALAIVISLGGNTLGQLQYVGSYLSNVLGALMAFVLPSVVVVAVKAILNLAKD